jgi:hypothetical protein
MAETTPVMDVARIGFVTRRFYELQGLGTVLFGCGIVLTVVMAHAIGSGSYYQRFPLQVLVFGNFVSLFAAGPVARHYRQNFGNPEAPTRRKATAGLLGMLVMAGGCGDATLQLSNANGPSVSAVVLAGYALCVAARDWRWRLHYLVAAAAGLIGVVATAAVPAGADVFGPAFAARGETFLLSYTLLGLALVVVGFLDHRLLASSLDRGDGPVSEMPESAKVRGSNGLSRAAIGMCFFLGAGGPLVWLSPAAVGSALPMTLLLALVCSQFAVAILQNGASWRHAAHVLTSTTSHGPPPAERPTSRIGADSLLPLCLVALAGALDAWVLPYGVPRLLALATAFWSLWVAVRDWRYRPYYLFGALAIAAAVFYGTARPSAVAFAGLIVAVGGSAALEGALDHWLSGRRRRIAGFPSA